MAMDFRFENGAIFNQLWILPVVWIFVVVSSRMARKKLMQGLGEKAYQQLTASVDSKKRRWKLFLQLLVIFLMALTLARPQAGQSVQEIKSEGIELMFVVDVSESMLAEDVRPNRLEQAKTELAKLSEKMTGSKIGIVAFAGSAAILSPLTTDPAALRMYLDSLSPSSVSSQGTDFRAAIEAAAEAFKRGGASTDEVTKVTRVIILASDGEDHEAGALEEARKVSGEGVRIFSLIYGTEKGAPIPERDGMGYLRGYKKDRSGQTILTTVKGDALRAIAEAGQGVAVHASFGGNHLDQIVAAIDQLEKSQFDTTMAIQYDERFQITALLALIVLLLEIYLVDRKTKLGPWLGRFAKFILIGTFFQFFVPEARALGPSRPVPTDSSQLASESPPPTETPAKAQAPIVGPVTVWQNEKAIRELKSGQGTLAQGPLLEALADQPLNSSLHLNLGLSFDLLSQAEKAKASYQQALENAKSPLEKFAALFNLGLIEQKAKNKDKALELYQQALAINPDSKEVKINIELLTQKNQGQKGEGDPKDDPNSDGNSDQNQKDQNQDSKNDPKDQDEKDPNKKDKPKKYAKNQPQQFKSQELTEGDVKKILGEIKQQEQKIRAEFNKKESKDNPKDKDW